MSRQAAHLAAVRSVLAATGREVLTYGEIEATPEDDRPTDYVLFDLERMFGGAELSDGTTGSTMWRLGTRAVSTDEDNARTLLDDCRSAIEAAALLVDGIPTGPINFESETGVAHDDGMFSGLIDWTYDHA